MADDLTQPATGFIARRIAAEREHVRQIFNPTGDAIDVLRTNLRVDTNMDLLGAVVIAVIALLLDSTGGLIYAGIIVVITLLRATAFRAYDEGDITKGLLIVVAGTWLLALPGVWLIPQGYPIHVVNVVGPLVLIVGYLPSDYVRWLAALGIGYIIVLGNLAFFHEGMVWAELFAEGAFEFSIIVALTAIVLLFMLDVRDANIEMQRNVEQTLAADKAVRESRRRLTTVADAERVRIERNIHDGAQQQLVAMAVSLQLAADQADDPEHRDLLLQLHEQTQSAISQLRELAHGVYPSVLAARGLVEALRSVARRSPHPVAIEADNEPIRLSEADEAALYFVCLEALQNSAKHAGPTTSSTIRLATSEDAVEVHISDTGPGFDVANVQNPRGLLNMSDRIAALGGDFFLTSSIDRGTAISVKIPMQHAADALRA